MKTDNIVVSSRIRLARNLSNLPFNNNTDLSSADKVLTSVFNAISEVSNFNLYKSKNLNQATLEELLEDHLISSDLIENSDISGVAVSQDKTVSIMVNEEDHLREQCILKGLDLKRAYDIINDIDTELSTNLNFAYDSELGYLTSCVSNVGTALRASVMMFLPGISLTNNVQDMITAVGKLGVCVRGVYGEGSKTTGFLYQISNMFSLGITEEEIIQLVESTALKICNLEIKARENLLNKNEESLKDEVLRDYGILSNCYTISSNEAIDRLSKLKLGVALNIINLKNSEIVDDLLNNVSAIKITKLSNKNLDEVSRDKFRAEYLNRVLKNLRY